MDINIRRSGAAALVLGASVSAAPAEVIEYACLFDSVSRPGENISAADLVMGLAWDSETNAAYVKDEGRPAVAVHIHGGPGGLTFMEPLAGGAVNVTTVAIDGRASHSRNTLAGEPDPEFSPAQFYGYCGWIR